MLGETLVCAAISLHQYILSYIPEQFHPEVSPMLGEKMLTVDPPTAHV